MAVGEEVADSGPDVIELYNARGDRLYADKDVAT